MHINVLSLFPSFFTEITEIGVVGRAFKQGIWSLNVVNPRSFANNRHGNIDDRPYGGGAGMVMSYEPLCKSLLSLYPERTPSSLQKESQQTSPKVVCLSPIGRRITQRQIEEYATLEEMTLICGRYEGIDQRFIDSYVDEEVSLGDFVLSGGEPAALCLIDSIMRLLPQVLGNEQSLLQESYSNQWDGLLDYPHYTRPEEIEGQTVPSVLLQGDHQKIEQWRRHMSLKITQERRSELMTKGLLEEYNKSKEE